MSLTWEGVDQPDALNDWVVKARSDIADAARDYAWDRVIDLVSEHPDFVNSTRPGGQSRYAPLHQAAHGGAPPDIIERLVALGAWRTLQNVRGERPVDVAVRRGHSQIREALEPVLVRHVPIGILLTIQRHFHTVISGRLVDRWDQSLDVASLRLPELEPLLELRDGQIWFPVPGMYGGFNYWLESDGVEATLLSESWSRVVGGSGQRHAITSAGAHLIDEGFV